MIFIQFRWNFFLFLYALLNINMLIQIDKNLRRKFLLNPVGFGKYKEESRFDVVKYHPSYVEYLVNTSIDSGDEMGEQVRNMVIAFEMVRGAFADECNTEWMDERVPKWKINHPELHCLV